MIETMALLIIYGTVISAHGCIYIDNSNMSLINVHPSLNDIINAIKDPNLYLGMTYSSTCRNNFIVLKFNNTGNCLVYYAINPIRNPLIIDIYISNDNASWKFVREDLADAGWHRILLPYSPKFVMIKARCSKFGGFGAILFKTIYLEKCEQNILKYKINKNYLYLFNIWIPIPMLIAFYCSMIVGLSIFINNKLKILLLSIIINTTLIILNLLFNINIFLKILGVYGILIQLFLCGLALGFFHDIFKQRPNNPRS